MKTIAATLLCFLLMAPAAKADMFDDAHNMGMNMPTWIDTGMLPSTAGARVRVDQINTIAPGIADALINATRERTEENRQRTCQLANRFDEAFEGIETLDGYFSLGETIVDLRESIRGAKNVLGCGGFQPSFCAGPIHRTLATRWLDTNGNAVNTSMEYNGTSGGQGSYRMPDGTIGRLSEIECGNSGLTLNARWLNERTGLSGYLAFYYTDRAATEFVGVWGFDDSGFKKFQGFWDGKLSNGSSTDNGQVPANGNYQIIGKLGKCLDVRDHSFASTAPMQQWDCTGERHQTFELRRVNSEYHEIITHAGMCISAEGNQPGNGVNMIQWACNKTPDQLVKLVPSENGYFTVRFQATGKCMDVQDTSANNGLSVHQWDCVGVPDQNWKFVRVAN